MSTLEERIQQIKTQYVGKTGLRVLLVEGSDDVDAFRIFLGRKFPEWEKSWLLAFAGKKADVVKMLKSQQDWLGVVDRDEWTETEIGEQKAASKNLIVLPRFCMESYLVDPGELWEAFPQNQKDKISGGEAQFRAELLAELKGWVRHAALWHGVRPLWRQLRDLGFPDSVLGSPPMPDDDALRAKFKDWHSTLDAEVVLAGVQALEAKLAAEDTSKLCTQWLYAKNFFPQIVHPVLDRLLGRKPAKMRRLSILRSRAVPADLDALWLQMGLIKAP